MTLGAHVHKSYCSQFVHVSVCFHSNVSVRRVCDKLIELSSQVFAEVYTKVFILQISLKSSFTSYSLFSLSRGQFGHLQFIEVSTCKFV